MSATEGSSTNGGGGGGGIDNNRNKNESVGRRISKANSKRKRSNNRNRNEGKQVRISKTLSWALRHAAPELGLTMGSDAYVAVDEILEHKDPKFRGFTLEDVKAVVEGNDKQRFGLKEDDDGKLYIRANQGHSIKTIDPRLLLTKLTSDQLSSMETIVHGTYKDAWEKHIQSEGLSRMNRTHIHLAAGMPGENQVISGMRKSCDVYVYVDGPKCAGDGIDFYRSANGVILTAGVEDEGILPPKYFLKVIDKAGNSLLG